jgi:hypothetical protein
MKARNFRPLVVVVEEDEELEFPQESRIRQAASRAMTVSKALFNLGLRRAFRNNNLDARKRIITERKDLPIVGRAEWLRRCGILYSRNNGE